MVSDSKVSFPDDLFCQMDLNSQSASSMEMPAFQALSEKLQNTADKEMETCGQSQGEDSPPGDSLSELSVAAGLCQYENDPVSRCNLKCTSNNSHEDAVDLDRMKRSHTGYDLPNPFKRARLSDSGISFELPPISASFHEDASGSNSSLSCNTSEEDCRSDLPFQPVSSPHLVDKKDQPSGYTSILDYYPRKHVVIGPNHQAVIPDWRPRPSTGLTDEDICEKTLMGTCIIPMQDNFLTSASPHDPMVSANTSRCSCDDEGSISCVRQHVMEAREKIKISIMPAQFIDLGFLDMGESVALRWMEEEEHIFQEVVAENPASLGKNFWDHLPRFLPSKSCKDLVSYYFNVFILRKRAEQNRSDPSNIDSDNDEWHNLDDGSEDYECDSAVKMVDGHVVYDSHDEDDEDDSEACHEELDDFLGNGHAHPSRHDIIQDESCTSFEAQNHGVTPAMRRSAAINGMVDHGYLVSPETKPWELGYFSGQEKSVDFLPTCHVIEEVFGKGSWASNGSNDGQGII